MPHSPPNRIMLSYRRADTAGITGRLYDRLTAAFGQDAVFKDVDSIPLGVDFKAHLEAVIARCDVLLVVIGDHWLAGRGGERRLQDPRDVVRIEVASALARDIPVIPVLVHKAAMPTEEDLPVDLKPLAFRNGAVIHHDPHFNADAARLIGQLRTLLAGQDALPEPPREVAPPRSRPPARLVEVVIPSLGESVQEGTVVAWHKRVGDPVGRDEALLELDTEKATMEIPAPAAGRVTEILARAGAKVRVGVVVARIQP